MTDREMLELAALAAGYVVESMRFHGGAWCHPVGEQPDEDGDHPGLFEWNPLDDDGDIARLEANLRINVTWISGGVMCGPCMERCADHPDANTARRKASVRAAAEVGRRMREGKA